MVPDRDDLNHLRLSCRMGSELASGLRYAYSRLDIIDRKASEIFRSYTFVFSLLVGLRSVLAGLHMSGGDSLALLIYLFFAVLALIAVCMAVQHKSISNLRFHRIAVAECDEAKFPALPDEDARVSLTSPRTAASLEKYLVRISDVTVQRERSLQVMDRLYSAGLAVSLLEAGLILIAAER